MVTQVFSSSRKFLWKISTAISLIRVHSEDRLLPFERVNKAENSIEQKECYKTRTIQQTLRRSLYGCKCNFFRRFYILRKFVSRGKATWSGQYGQVHVIAVLFVLPLLEIYIAQCANWTKNVRGDSVKKSINIARHECFFFIFFFTKSTSSNSQLAHGIKYHVHEKIR